MSNQMSRTSSGNLDVFADDDLKGLVAEIADKLERVQVPKKKSGRATSRRSDHGIKQMQKTYLSMARNSLTPMVRYVKAIMVGVSNKELCEIMSYIVSPLLRKTKQVGLDEHARKLRTFHSTLQNTLNSESRVITDEQAQSLYEAYWPVYEHFKLDMRGHSLAVANLLFFFRKLKRNSKIDDNDIKRLFAIGIPSITMLRKSSLEDLQSLSGLSQERVRIIRKHAREFQLEWYLE